MTPPSRPTRPPGPTPPSRPRRWGLPAALVVGVACAAPAPAAAAPAVKVSMTPVAKPLSTSASKATVTVRNATKRRLTGLTVSVRPPKGVLVTVTGAKRGTTKRAVKALKARGTARIAVRLRRTKTGPTTGRLTVKVTRKGKALGTGRLAFGPTPVPKPAPTPTPAPPPPPAPAPPPLAGRYFWGLRLDPITGNKHKTLYFAGPSLVQTAPMDGAFATCPAESEECRPYTHDPATGQLVVNGEPATVAGRRITVGSDSYDEVGVPPPGTRWDTVVTYVNSTGICPTLYCNHYREDLTFLPDGTFVRGSFSAGVGGGGDWSVVPADSKGTYEVRPDRTLRLAFADGKERIETVGQFLNDDGSLKPASEGLILGGEGYFDIRD
jgi:hypothetical protein